jgi:hypothetical protein
MATEPRTNKAKPDPDPIQPEPAESGPARLPAQTDKDQPPAEATKTPPRREGVVCNPDF